ncbi:hypothetical protein V6N13_015462 [Hibiscus sabdariffa]|uniref:Uncharacterized protein n=1 Tax=Hibiscus sabdariffa TaxID=183260 RepID=A0ABR2CVR0_9ROSI
MNLLLCCRFFEIPKKDHFVAVSVESIATPFSFFSLFPFCSFILLQNSRKMVALMDFMGKFQCVNSYGKKHCRSIFWRMKAAWRRRSKQQLQFRYDPLSYALNFDDGCCRTDSVEAARFLGCSDCKNIICVYVLWVK